MATQAQVEAGARVIRDVFQGRGSIRKKVLVDEAERLAALILHAAENVEPPAS